MDRHALEARGLLVTGGFIDLHAHLREPGFEESETIATGAAAALRGGFTTICAMPNTDPAIDSPGLVAEVVARASAAHAARVLPIAAITRGRGGRELADLMELSAAGAVAFSDDGSPVDDPRLFRHALEYSRARDLLIIEHPEDRALSSKGVMHEGAVSARLGLPGIPAAAEESAVARDIALARLTGARLHLTHLSTAGSIELVRRAKGEGVRVTCDVTPHHLALTDAWVAGSRRFAWETQDDGTSDATALRRADAGSSSAPAATPYDSNTKMNPPLRTAADVRALWAGLADGTVDAIATDHAPHASTKKDVEFDHSANGISGLETALPLVLGGVAAGWCAREVALRALSAGPARVLGIPLPADDWIAIDPAAVWRPRAEDLATRGKNTPLLGLELRGRVVVAVVGGEVRFDGGVRAAV
ncbi:MAG TPA: dihydroorotase [Candidatus Limnocylindria bacterium]|nr:dihydroorotase [Candidatus Limnocylindria bacterium]